MRTIHLQPPAGLDALKLTEVPTPQCKPGEVLVRVRASSVNFHDQAVVSGQIPTESKRIPMSDGAGEVVDGADDVTAFKKGDYVIGTFFPNWHHGDPDDASTRAISGETVDGFAAEYVAVAATSVTRAPIGWSHAEAATLVCAGVTAWRALKVSGHLKRDDVVLTLGTGGVSIFAIQIAKSLGATVISTSASDEKLERLRALGADHLINYRATPNWGNRALEITGGRGVDHVIDIGGGETLQQSLAASRLGGHIAAIGVLSGTTATFSTIPLIKRQIRLQGITVGSRSHQEDLVSAVEQFEFRPVIDSHFALAELADAFKHEQSHRHFGKICIDI
jgi:NADPH:quinone reductase-like Zn-dependent oxidoreductase